MDSVSEVRSSDFPVIVKHANDIKGNGLFAATAIHKDAVIFKELPLVSAQFSWNKLYKYTACDHCMKSLEPAEDMAKRLTAIPSLVLPYPECCEVKTDTHVRCLDCQVQYCSEGCRERAYGQFHRSLCLGASLNDEDHPLNQLDEIWRNIHYPPETTTIMLIARIIATIKQASDKPIAVHMFNNFCKSTENEQESLVLKLLGNKFVDQLEVVRHQLTEAMYEESVSEWFTKEGFLSLVAMIGCNGQGVGTSSISAYVENVENLNISEEEREQVDQFIDQMYHDLEKESGTFLNCEGSALYALQSRCNHSCSPNAEIQYLDGDSTLSLVALSNIADHEEVTISYLDECDRNRSRHSRQKILQENYLFVCTCMKCEAQMTDDDETSEEEASGSSDENSSVTT